MDGGGGRGRGGAGAGSREGEQGATSSNTIYRIILSLILSNSKYLTVAEHPQIRLPAIRKGGEFHKTDYGVTLLSGFTRRKADSRKTHMWPCRHA